jgi:hypothetical protein
MRTLPGARREVSLARFVLEREDSEYGRIRRELEALRSSPADEER